MSIYTKQTQKQKQTAMRRLLSYARRHKANHVYMNLLLNFLGYELSYDRHISVVLSDTSEDDRILIVNTFSLPRTQWYPHSSTNINSIETYTLHMKTSDVNEFLWQHDKHWKIICCGFIDKCSHSILAQVANHILFEPKLIQFIDGYI